MISESRRIQLRAASARYHIAHQDAVKKRHAAYREANRAKRKAYATDYRRRKGVKERHFLPAEERRQPRAINASVVPQNRENGPCRAASRAADKINETMGQFIACEYCESQIRKGSDQYFNGNMTDLGFCCELCQGGD